MATSGPKKASLAESKLPSLTVFDDGTVGYNVRYRIVSEDINRFSPYSPVYKVRPNYIFERPNGKSISDASVVRIGPYVNIVWDPISVKDRITQSLIKQESQYDVWISWTKGESEKIWILTDRRIDGNIQGAIVPSSYDLDDGNGGTTTVQEEPDTLSVEVYVRAITPSRNNTPLLVYELTDQDISVPVPDPNV